MSDTSAIQNYIIYLTKTSGGGPVGTVVNIVLYDGSAKLNLPDGQAIQADPERKYPIGSIYEASNQYDQC